ncbi:MAG: family N-acetyltransferase [Ilumatobacteraceae bacterium]|nr:family N-acetyltransferase [Ilumatobacteraceae bacterium]
MSEAIVIRSVEALEARQRSGELVAIIRDAVDGGSSVNFLADVTDEVLGDFWAVVADAQEAGRTRLFVAEDVDDHAGGRFVATALIMFSQKQNSPHRADVGKMLVHSGYRRRGLARRLLDAIEGAARDHGRTLLMLDTETGSAGEALYRANDWVAFGVVPGHAYTPDGAPKPTTFFYKVIDPQT